MSSQVGSGFVAVFPTFKGFRKATMTEVDAATGDASKSMTAGFTKGGTTAGRGFKNAFNTSAKDTASDVLKAANREYADASRQLSGLRSKEMDAAGKVRVAEVALAEARAKTGNESARSVAAEERLATAQRNLSTVQDSVKTSSDRLTQAKRQLANATEQANGSAARSQGFFASVASSAKSGFGSALESARTFAGYLGSKLASAISAIWQGLLTVGKIGVGAFTGLIAVAGALVIKGGISRMLDIEDAKAKLKGLGNSVEDVNQILGRGGDAFKAVSGTAFTMADAAGVAATAVAANIKPGQQLERYLRYTADAATIAGVSLNEMGDILNKVAIKGKASMENVNQLQERNIPILVWLAEEYGVTADAMQDMVSRGEVDAETFQRVIEKNIGGAALSAGDNTRGALANMRASMSRLGETLLKDIFPQFRVFFTNIGAMFDRLGGSAEGWSAKFTPILDKAFNGMNKILDVIGNIAEADGGFSFANIQQQFTDAFPQLDVLFQLVDAFSPAFQALADAVSDMAPELGELALALVPLIPALTEIVRELIPPFVDFLVAATPVLVAFAGIIQTYVVPAVSGLLGGLRDMLGSVNFLIEGFQNGSLGSMGFAFGLGQLPGPIGVVFGALNGLAKGALDFGQNVGNVINEARAGFERFANGVGQQIQSAVSTIASFPGRILDSLSGSGNLLVSTGANMMRGWVDGIMSGLGSLISTVANAAAQAVAAAKSALGIHSPSRVFRNDVGAQISAGMALGISDNEAQVVDAVRRLSDVSTDISFAASTAVPTAASGASAGGPRDLVVVDADGTLIGRMRIEADRAIAGRDRIADLDRRAGWAV